jgi:hypothetical protein
MQKEPDSVVGWQYGMDSRWARREKSPSGGNVMLVFNPQ